jgi:uncharacterized damage-inducible protein DinB
MPAGDYVEQFREYSTSKLRDHFAQAARCTRLLSEEQVWFRPNGHSNSVANLLLHLRGNLSQWILAGLGGREVTRQRQAEFDARGGVGRAELLAGLDATVGQVCEVIAGLPPEGLTRTYKIQEYEVSGTAAILHVVEHFAFHTGQIVTTTKWLLDIDLSLYDERGHRRDGRDQGVP